MQVDEIFACYNTRRFINSLNSWRKLFLSYAIISFLTFYISVKQYSGGCARVSIRKTFSCRIVYPLETFTFLRSKCFIQLELNQIVSNKVKSLKLMQILSWPVKLKVRLVLLNEKKIIQCFMFILFFFFQCCDCLSVIRILKRKNTN